MSTDPRKILDADYTHVERRIMAHMAQFDRDATRVVERFHEDTKTAQGTPLFRLHTGRVPDELSSTARLLKNMIVDTLKANYRGI